MKINWAFLVLIALPISSAIAYADCSSLMKEEKVLRFQSIDQSTMASCRVDSECVNSESALWCYTSVNVDAAKIIQANYQTSSYQRVFDQIANEGCRALPPCTLPLRAPICDKGTCQTQY